jgi:choline dehydrogenase
MSSSTDGRHRTVVVGAGSAGGVLAAQLSKDPTREVILVEAGPDYLGPEEMPASLLDAYNPQLAGHDWELVARFVENADRPEVAYPRGKVVGGSSAVNGSVGVRGRPEDFDDWAKLGNEGWSWEDVLPIFEALEDDQDFGDRPFHNTGGPVTIFRLGADTWPESLQAIGRSFEKLGISECADANAPDASGYGPIPRNQRDDLRGSTLVTFVNPARGRDNLTVLAETMVRRVVIEDGRAVGVEVNGANGNEVIRGDEVVLCAGATNSPQLLMLSGIGPAAELAKHGIEVVADVPGVGRNMQDHPFIPLVAAAAKSDPARHGFRMMARTSSSTGTPNDLTFVMGQVEKKAMNFAVDSDSEDMVMLQALLAKPTSRGWLTLRSADPGDGPEIHVNFLGTAEDMDRIKEAYKLLVQVATSSETSALMPTFVMPAPDVSGNDLLAWLESDAADEWIRHNVTTGYHGAGTCRMGPDSDAMAVVDPHLKVRGIEGLYVADASIMPEITNGLTNLSCYVIGAKAAEVLSNQ